MSSTMPISVYMLTGIPAIIQPKIAPRRAIGTPIMAAIGLVQLSYCAASTRKATSRASARIIIVFFPAAFS